MTITAPALLCAAITHDGEGCGCLSFIGAPFALLSDAITTRSTSITLSPRNKAEGTRSKTYKHFASLAITEKQQRKGKKQMADRPKKAGNAGAEVQRLTAERRAESYFLVYYNMRPRRSLPELGRLLREMGVKITDATLMRYSSDYKWQQRVAELDATITDPEKGRELGVVRDMNYRQARLGEAMQGIAAQVLSNVDHNNLDPMAATKMAKEGVLIERLALEKAASRSQTEAQIFEQVLSRVALLFQQINIIPDRDERQKRFDKGTEVIAQDSIPILLVEELNDRSTNARDAS